jgi:hypothetical protein
MVKQEDKYYRYRNYLVSDDHLASPCCTCKDSQRALHLLEECAMLVTDLTCLRNKPKADIIRSPSAVSVLHFEKSHGNSPSLCCVCHKPLHQEKSFPPEDSLRFWREQMFEWACMVVDSYELMDRTGVVALSFSLLDRYVAHELQTGGAKKTIKSKDFQLFSITTLYIAMKFLEGRKLTMDSLVGMSLGFYKTQDFVETEQAIYTALEWRLNAPTAISYCRLMLDALLSEKDCKSRCGRRQRADLENCCATLTEIAVLDVSLMAYTSSVVAMASIALAARLHGLPKCEITKFISDMDDLIETSGYDSEFQRVYRHLERVYCD